jgi:hypothetical protein
MTAKLRRAAVLILCSGTLGLVTSALVHAEFEAMKRVLGVGALVSFSLFIVAAVIGATGRRDTYRAASQTAIVVALSVPLAFVTSPFVFRVDLWRAKRFVETEVSAKLEQDHSRTGRYPKEWRIWEAPPTGAPWLVQRFSYYPDGQGYGLSVMNPGVCGHVVSYRSSTQDWVETYKQCWY